MRPLYYKPDYSKYTLNELYDVLENIDRERYNDRYLEVKAILDDPVKLATLKKKQVKFDEKQEQQENREIDTLNAIAFIGYGCIILFFGMGLSKGEGFFEIESPLVRFFSGVVFCIVGVVAVKRIKNKKH